MGDHYEMTLLPFQGFHNTMAHHMNHATCISIPAQLGYLLLPLLE